MMIDAMIGLIPIVVTVALTIAVCLVLITRGGKEYRVQVLLVVIAHAIYYIGGEVIDRLDGLIRLSAYALRIVE